MGKSLEKIERKWQSELRRAAKHLSDPSLTHPTYTYLHLRNKCHLNNSLMYQKPTTGSITRNDVKSNLKSKTDSKFFNWFLVEKSFKIL